MSIPTKAIKAVIINQGRILLLQRNKETRGTDNWDLPGGLMEENESEEETLLREVFEEIPNIRIKILYKFNGQWQFKRLKDEQVVVVQNYLCEIIHPIPEKLQLSEEHSDYKWIEMHQIEELPTKDMSMYGNILENKDLLTCH